MVFFVRQDAPDPAQGVLRSLRPSMNSPVVVVEDLPAGPATAAIACLSGPAGPHVALAIRSRRSGQVVFFGPDEDLREAHACDDALDAALGFAEGLGFLFEDDRVAEAPAEAWQLWDALLEAGARIRRLPPRDPARVAAAPPEASAPEELWLEEVLAPGPAVGGSVPLSKFRSAGPAPPRPRERSAARAADLPHGRFRVSPARRSP